MIVMQQHINNNTYTCFLSFFHNYTSLIVRLNFGLAATLYALFQVKFNLTCDAFLVIVTECIEKHNIMVVVSVTT